MIQKTNGNFLLFTDVNTIKSEDVVVHVANRGQTATRRSKSEYPFEQDSEPKQSAKLLVLLDKEGCGFE